MYGVCAACPVSFFQFALSVAPGLARPLPVLYAFSVKGKAGKSSMLRAQGFFSTDPSGVCPLIFPVPGGDTAPGFFWGCGAAVSADDS